MVFRFKCYILPFFGRSDGNVDKYSGPYARKKTNLNPRLVKPGIC